MFLNFVILKNALNFSDLFCSLSSLYFTHFLKIFFSFIFISWRLITLQYCSGFCHTLTWISHGFTCIPHPDPPSHLINLLATPCSMWDLRSLTRDQICTPFIGSEKFQPLDHQGSHRLSIFADMNGITRN